MEQLKEIVLNICLICLLLGVLNYLLPEGTLGKSAGWIVSLYMVLVLLSPIAQGYDFSQLFSPEFSTFTLRECSETTADLLEKAAVVEVEQTISSISQQHQVPVSIVSLKTSEKDYQIYIDRIELSVNGTADQKNQVIHAVESVINTSVVIVEE